MQQIEAERLEAERRRREAERAVRDREAWAKAALDALWVEVHAQVEARAAEFTRATGSKIEIVRHARADDGPGNLGALRILELRVGLAVVYLYTHHEPGSAVHVHVAQWPAASGSGRRHHRMISLPVCTLERTGEDGWVLERVSARSTPRSLTPEDLVYRAFELLVCGFERPESNQPKAAAPAGAHAPVTTKTVRQFPSD
ncbi:MAG: hypothetical protein IPI67_11795 [Myxococcales bacterium]|nr:hypothetical protein [Myxococcales bacterium]